jgi:hypothetical protein
MNTTLAEQQRALRHAIVATDGAAGSLLRGDAPGLRVYRHAYVARLVAALRDNCGCLPRVMGDEAFDELATAYVAAHPSRHPSIRWFGHRLAAFMQRHGHLVPHPALVDLARMEWALRAAFDAADAAPLDAASLAALPPADWPGLVFEVLPSVQALAMQWAVEPVWRAFQHAAPGEDPQLPEPQAQAHTLLVWRAGFENRWRVVDGVEAQLLHAMVAGRDFAALCDIAQTAERAVAALHAWLADGLVARVQPGSKRGC